MTHSGRFLPVPGLVDGKFERLHWRKRPLRLMITNRFLSTKAVILHTLVEARGRASFGKIWWKKENYQPGFNQRRL